jgi:hypothetical protein
MDMYSRIDEYIQGENRRKPMTSDEMMRFYGLNAQRQESAVKRFGAFMSKTLETFRHRAGLTMPADAANAAPAYRRI